MVSCRNMVWAYFRASPGCSTSDLAQLTLDVLQRINVMNGAKTFVLRYAPLVKL